MGFLAAVILGFFEQPIQGLMRFDMRDFSADRRLVAVLHQVHSAKTRRIHAQFLGDQIHLRLIGENSLGIPRCPHVAARHFIRVDNFFFDQHVGHSIRPRRFMGAKEIADRFERAIGAAVENEIHVMSEDTAVCRYAGLYLHDRSMSWIPGAKLVAIIHHHFHRPAALQ